MEREHETGHDGRDRKGARRAKNKHGRGDKTKPGPGREVEVSKKLSWLLRHGAEQEGLKLGPGGYITVDKVLATRRIASTSPKIDLREIKEIVGSNEKQRFSLVHISSQSTESAAQAPAPAPEEEKALDQDTDPTNWLIRANQGHSLKVDTAGLLKEISLSEKNIPAIVVHGSLISKWKAILGSGGLKPMTRNHIHFATGVPKQLELSFKLTDIQPGTPDADKVSHDDDVSTLSVADADSQSPAEVKSGMRVTSSLLIFIDISKAIDSGIKFWMSENGVVLSEGNEAKIVPVEMFKKVVQIGGKVLLEDGLPTPAT